MNEETILRKLAGAARGDAPPLLDVSDAVMSDVMGPIPSKRTMMWVFAAVSSAAAVIVTAIALHAITLQHDPFGDLVRSTMASIR